jgi:ankyrin repeat protein
MTIWTDRGTPNGCRARWALSNAATLIFALAVPGCGGLEKLLPEGTPALHRAAADNDVVSVKRLASRDKVDQRGPYGWTPLHYAAVFGGLQAAEELLTRGAHLDPVDNVGMTPLHWAARKGRREIVDLLLQKGAEVMARNSFDMTPLHEATTPEVAELLLQRGADLHARDIDGMTPLHTATTKPVADLLIKKGADVNAQSKDGRSPLDMPPSPKPRAK